MQFIAVVAADDHRIDHSEHVIMRTTISIFAFAVFSFAPAAPVPKMESSDWPCFGGDGSRNNANHFARNLPHDFSPSEDKPLNLLWQVDLGTRAYGQAVIANGYILVGTNNERPRNTRDQIRNQDGEIESIDKGILICFEAETGKFAWQAVHDKLPGGIGNDWPRQGIVSTPCIDGNRVYYMSNRCELVCADLKGFADGNQGIQKEQYDDPTDADFLWRNDIIKDYGVFPHNIAACSPLIVNDAVFIVTGNGVDQGHSMLPSPDAPSFMAFDKLTGKLLWKDNSPGKNIMHGQWSSPSYTAKPVPQVIFPGGDGWIRAFEPSTGKLLWKFDGNPKGTEYKIGGDGDKSDFIAMPVIHDGKMFIGTGQDPEHFSGVAHLWCVDLAKAVEFGKTNKNADVSPVGNDFDPKAKANQRSALEWHYGGAENRKHAFHDFSFGRTLSNVVVVGDVLYACEIAGVVHCINAKTGKRHWVYDVRSSIWATPLYAEGKVYVPSEGGDLFVFDHMPKPFTLDTNEEMAKTPTQKAANARAKVVKLELEKRLNLKEIEFDQPIRSAPTAVGNVLYVKTESKLYAFQLKR
jgi:outer membrane protein assembly factor BamB